MAEPVPVTKEAIDRVEARLTSRIDENEKHIKQNSESIIKLETLYNTLVKLPDTIVSLEKAMIRIDHNMQTMATRMDNMTDNLRAQRDSIDQLKAENQKQDESIRDVDNKSKVDWAKAVTQNFWKVVLAVAGAIVAWKSLTGA